MGWRNLTPEAKSYLRGQRYNLEKKGEGRPEKLDENQPVSGGTAKRLAVAARLHRAVCLITGRRFSSNSLRISQVFRSHYLRTCSNYLITA
jgi:hypothetical protein